mgnify:CR=1 FL=1
MIALGSIGDLSDLERTEGIGVEPLEGGETETSKTNVSWPLLEGPSSIL